MKKLTINQEGFSEQLLSDVAFSPSDLDSAFINQASLFCFYAEQSRLASKKMDNFKLLIDTTESQLDKEIRDEAAKSSTKLTEKSIEQTIMRDERYVKTVTAYNDAKATHQMLRDILEAFKQRSMMLIQIGATRREESKTTGFRMSAESEGVHYSQAELKAKRDALFVKKNVEAA